MRYWLMKAEPNSRIEKGKDVKFSVDDFESIKTTPWEGVRNHEAKKIMQSMKVGDQVLFYHSNCKNPGIAGFAEITKEAYPDHTAWDSEHPYYDPKSDKENPKWFMVDVTFKSRAKHFVALSLIKRISAMNDLSEDIAYIGAEGHTALKGMALINRGRLSVQPVEVEAWDTITRLADTGGWDEDAPGKAPSTDKKPQRRKGPVVADEQSQPPTRGQPSRGQEHLDNGPDSEEQTKKAIEPVSRPLAKKRKAGVIDENDKTKIPQRRSTRTRRIINSLLISLQ